jgi:hypothetical protein
VTQGWPMRRVILDRAAIEKLLSSGEAVAVCDEAGRSRGVSRPAASNIHVPFSEEELERAKQETGGRPLADILADLNRLT